MGLLVGVRLGLGDRYLLISSYLDCLLAQLRETERREVN
jgi:hypothetical protein